MKAQQEPWLNALGKPRKQKNEELEFDDIPDRMKSAKRWLLWKKKKDKDGKDRKIPHYVNHMPRSGDLDSPEDLAQLSTFEQAVDALQAGFYTGLGFALGGDGTGNYWQGVDLDKITEHPGLEDIADDLPGYTETSPSGKGRHAIGYGKKFGSMGSNGSGVEAYCEGRFFTVTGEGAGLGDIEDIAEFVNKRLAPVHGGQRRADTSSGGGAPLEAIPASAQKDLRSALCWLDPDDRQLWIEVGHALKTGGEAGKNLWIEWSMRSDKWQPSDARKWEDLKAVSTNWRSVFNKAQQAGWSNTGSTPPAVVDSPAVRPKRELECINSDDIDISDEQYEDELIERILNKDAMSVLYGDSNSGKTFLAVDMACKLATGQKWMGRNAIHGAVVYLATEGFGSVRKRIKAYKREFRINKLPVFVVKSPVNFFSNTDDTAAVVELVRKIERETGIKVVLVIGDTMARIAAGANENTGQDMTIVLHHADTIRNDCAVHFLWIHHTGKDAARGARGWSGIRAAIDTEIEVVEAPGNPIRSVEITKQRDGDGKGDRYGFVLIPVTIGKNQWGSDMTSCVIMQQDAPPKSSSGGVKADSIEAHILAFLEDRKSSAKRSAIADYVCERAKNKKGEPVSTTSVYNKIKEMVEAKKLMEFDGAIQPTSWMPKDQVLE